MNREQIPFVVSRLVGGRPVRWIPSERLVGDYDGRERTLQIFNADAQDQRRLLDVVDAARGPLQEAAGGPSSAEYGALLGAALALWDEWRVEQNVR